MTEAEVKWMNERNGGNYGAGTAEMQQRNYVSKKEGERKRRELFDDALMKFKSGKIEAASALQHLHAARICAWAPLTTTFVPARH